MLNRCIPKNRHCAPWMDKGCESHDLIIHKELKSAYISQYDEVDPQSYTNHFNHRFFLYIQRAVKRTK
jgi:hypothetical protein